MTERSIQVGDIVHVRGEVTDFKNGDFLEVRIEAAGAPHLVFSPNEIVRVGPRPLAVGDRVTPKQSDYEAEIRAIDVGDALCRWIDTHAAFACPLSDLTRINGEPS